MSPTLDRVASRFLSAYEFPTQQQLDDYLKAHPNADKSKHTVADPKRTEQRKKVELTNTNKSALRRTLEESADKNGVIRRVAPVHIPHLRRCIDAGWLEAVPGESGAWRLSAEGKKGLGMEEKEPEKPKEPKKSYEKKYPKAVVEVMDKHKLTDDDADEVRKFKKSKPSKGAPVSDAELMRRFKAKASPEMKERMKDMTPAEFKAMLAAISDEEDGGGKSASRVAAAWMAKRGGLSQLESLLGLLHALYWLHWTTHWQTKGNPAYGDHLLFERLYGAMPPEIDALAEKMVQLYGPLAVDVGPHLPAMSEWLSGWQDPDPVGRLLGAERDLQAALVAAKDALEAEGQLSLGIDDYLAAVANTHETHLYLLQQRMGGILDLKAAALDGDGKPDMSAEGHFFDMPRQREVREFAESKALTNDVAVSKDALRQGEGDRKLQRAVNKSPPTVAEILDETPGSKDFSALSRYLVQTEQPTDPGVPQSHDEIPKHPDIK